MNLKSCSGSRTFACLPFESRSLGKCSCRQRGVVVDVVQSKAISACGARVFVSRMYWSRCGRRWLRPAIVSSVWLFAARAHTRFPQSAARAPGSCRPRASTSSTGARRRFSAVHPHRCRVPHRALQARARSAARPQARGNIRFGCWHARGLSQGLARIRARCLRPARRLRKRQPGLLIAAGRDLPPGPVEGRRRRHACAQQEHQHRERKPI